MLIDGNHRAYRRLAEGRALAVYVLSTEEAQACFAGGMFGALPRL